MVDEQARQTHRCQTRLPKPAEALAHDHVGGHRGQRICPRTPRRGTRGSGAEARTASLEVFLIDAEAAPAGPVAARDPSRCPTGQTIEDQKRLRSISASGSATPRAEPPVGLEAMQGASTASTRDSSTKEAIGDLGVLAAQIDRPRRRRRLRTKGWQWRPGRRSSASCCSGVRAVLVCGKATRRPQP